MLPAGVAQSLATVPASRTPSSQHSLARALDPTRGNDAVGGGGTASRPWFHGAGSSSTVSSGDTQWAFMDGGISVIPRQPLSRGQALAQFVPLSAMDSATPPLTASFASSLTPTPLSPALDDADEEEQQWEAEFGATVTTKGKSRAAGISRRMKKSRVRKTTQAVGGSAGVTTDDTAVVPVNGNEYEY